MFGLGSFCLQLGGHLKPLALCEEGSKLIASSPGPSGAGTECRGRPATSSEPSTEGRHLAPLCLQSSQAAAVLLAEVPGSCAVKFCGLGGSALTVLPASGHEGLGSRWVSLEVGILIFKHSKMCCN